MSKITQGDWRVGDAGHTVFGPPQGDSLPEVIASVRKPANAKLIAVAPKMYKALQKIQIQLTGHPEVCRGNSRVHYCEHLARKTISEVEES
jgi:hypothetical protein